MSTGLKFGLNLTKKPGPKPPLARAKPIFGDDRADDSDGADVADVFKKSGNGASKSSKPSGSLSRPSSKKPNTEFASLLSRQTGQKQKQAAEELDPSIFDYDGAYDALHADRAAKEEEKRRDAQERKPRYMSALMESAKVREKDRLRAQDKLLQREREQEGDDFADKEKFVTSAYKKQQEEIRQEEEEERRREEEDAKKNEGKGMLSFHRKMMEKDDERHRKAVEAAKNIDPFKVRKSDDKRKEKSDIDIARELQEQGRNVIINEEGEVADKRQLLSAGLNVAPKPKVASGPATALRKAERSEQASSGYTFDRKAQRERQSRMVEAQLEQAAKRAADDEAEEQRKKEHAAKSRKTDSDISSAKERYLQRKKEAAEAAAKGKQP